MKGLRFFVVGLCLLAACGGRAEVFADRSKSEQRGITLPDPVPATPVFLIETQGPLEEETIADIEETDGVAVIASLSRRMLPVRGPGGKQRLRVATIEPLEFRSVAPPSTRDAEFVWVSLIVGQALPTFDAARDLGLSGAGEIQIAGTGYQVGAFADNGAPNVADILIQSGDEKQLRTGEPTAFVVGAESGTTIETLGRTLRTKVPAARLTRLTPQDTAPAQATTTAPQPVGYAEGGVIGSMTFQILPNGFIRPDPTWVQVNIVEGSVPILGTVRCHRLMIPRLAQVLQAVVDAGLADEIRPGDYGGCYVPRFIDRDPGKPLSNHAFGLAVDLNVSTNGLGTRGDMHPRIVEIFERFGFSWGGYWARPDPMHFELTG